MTDPGQVFESRNPANGEVLAHLTQGTQADVDAAVSAARPPGDYTARVIPHCTGVAIPLEDTRILWQR
mgnify:CR=1 FL=1